MKWKHFFALILNKQSDKDVFKSLLKLQNGGVELHIRDIVLYRNHPVNQAFFSAYKLNTMFSSNFWDENSSRGTIE